MSPHALVLAGLLAAQPVLPAATAGWSRLPDWSGDWLVTPRPRPPPPYNAEWTAKQAAAAAALQAGTLKDPMQTCGLPVGAVWMLSLPDIHEWILRPEEAWHSVENGGTVSRIVTNGQPHLSGDDLFPTYTGDSVGRWEGDTLVIDTVGVRDDTWLGPGALIHSDRLHLSERLHKTAADRLEAQVTVEDPVAFARPWRFTVVYRRLPAGSFVRDYACKVVRSAAD